MGKANIMTYKGYYTKITYDSELKMLTGIVEDINDLIYFEGKDGDSIINEFHKAVDDYLVFCKENNIKPNKTYKGTFNVRIDTKLHRKLSYYAFKNNQSLNSVVEEAIRHYIEYNPNKVFEEFKKSITSSFSLLSQDNSTLINDWESIQSGELEGSGSSSETSYLN